MKKRTRPLVLLADDHRMVAEAIANLLSANYELLDIVPNGNALVESAIKNRPDVILTDASMPVCSGIDAIKKLYADGYRIPAIFMTVHDEPIMVREALQTGARGYILKAAAAEELLKALSEVIDGHIYVSPELWPYVSGQEKVPRLTNMQQKVLEMLYSGLRSREIAEKLSLSARTVDSHRYAIMRVLNVNSSVSLIREAERLGLIKR